MRRRTPLRRGEPVATVGRTVLCDGRSVERNDGEAIVPQRRLLRQRGYRTIGGHLLRITQISNGSEVADRTISRYVRAMDPGPRPAWSPSAGARGRASRAAASRGQAPG